MKFTCHGDSLHQTPKLLVWLAVFFICRHFSGEWRIDIVGQQLSVISFCYTHTHTRKLTCAHTHTPFYSSMDFVRHNLGELVPEETFTHWHLSWSSIVPYLLHPSITIHGILPVQSTCLTIFFDSLQVFFGLPLGLAPSTSCSIHFFTQSLSSFHNTCNLFHCS